MSHCGGVSDARFSVVMCSCAEVRVHDFVRCSMVAKSGQSCLIGVLVGTDRRSLSHSIVSTFLSGSFVFFQIVNWSRSVAGIGSTVLANSLSKVMRATGPSL